MRLTLKTQYVMLCYTEDNIKTTISYCKSIYRKTYYHEFNWALFVFVCMVLSLEFASSILPTL